MSLYELTPVSTRKKSKEESKRRKPKEELTLEDSQESSQEGSQEGSQEDETESKKPKSQGARRRAQFRKRHSSRYNQNIPLGYSGHIQNGVKEILGGSVMDLRGFQRKIQQEKATLRRDYDSDSDSDTDLTETIRHLAEEDTTWFRGCGFRFTFETTILFTQILVALGVIVFCIFKLLITDDCSVMGTYAPLLSAIVAYFLPGPGIMYQNNSREK